MLKQWFNVGKIVNTHGVKGEVRVISRTDFPEERYKPGNALYLFLEGKDEPVQVTVSAHRLHKQFHLLQFKEVETLTEAEKLKNALIKVPEDQLSQFGGRRILLSRNHRLRCFLGRRGFNRQGERNFNAGRQRCLGRGQTGKERRAHPLY